MTFNKTYVLDTNVLVHDPESIFGFKNSTIAIPISVLEELDTFKKETTDRGYNAREVIRKLDMLRASGSLKEGVLLANGGTLKILFPLAEGPDDFSMIDDSVTDNVILLMALQLQRDGQEVKFISKDLNARVKADALGIQSEDYVKGRVSSSDFYKGWRTVQVPAVSLKKDIPFELSELSDLVYNEFVYVESRSNPHNYKLFRYQSNRTFKPVFLPTMEWPFEARNLQQLMALDLLFDESIQLICLLGPAGTGKTFLALLAGLHQVLISNFFEKMLISRPVVPLGQDIGYLPGTIEEKLHSWMQPVYDNMDFILHTINVGRKDIQSFESRPLYTGRRGMKKKHVKRNSRHEFAMNSIDELIKSGKISLEAITYMRGRSIPYQYILIDEVQNLTPHEVKTLISRVGEGSKIILAGDPYQIDSPYLDFSSNGLMVASSKFKGQSIFGTVFLENSERSLLSKMVSEVW